MLLMPGVEGLSMRVISCKVISCSTHEAVMFLPLVVVYCLSHSKAQPLNDIWLGHLKNLEIQGQVGAILPLLTLQPTPMGAEYLLRLSL